MFACPLVVLGAPSSVHEVDAIYRRPSLVGDLQGPCHTLASCVFSFFRFCLSLFVPFFLALSISFPSLCPFPRSCYFLSLSFPPFFHLFPLSYISSSLPALPFFVTLSHFIFSPPLLLSPLCLFFLPVSYVACNSLEQSFFLAYILRSQAEPRTHCLLVLYFRSADRYLYPCVSVSLPAARILYLYTFFQHHRSPDHVVSFGRALVRRSLCLAGVSLPSQPQPCAPPPFRRGSLGWTF